VSIARSKSAAPLSLSLAEARRIALRAQGVLTAKPDRTASQVLRRLGAVQLDTISVLARSHELVAYARAGAVGRRAVESAYWSSPAKAFEYNAHANCILPIEAWPYFAFRRRVQRLRTNKWRKGLPPQATKEVRARLQDGPVTTADLGGARNGVAGWWNWSDAKLAVELLYYYGEVAVTQRRSWKRIYDLPERVIKPELLAREVSDADCYRWLVADSARAQGIATRRDLADYHRLLTTWVGIPTNAKQLLDEAIAAAGLFEASVDGWDEPAYVHPAALKVARGEMQRPVLLSPFDSLVWAPRMRMERFFGKSMKIQAYTPKEERLHGYFVMPLLADETIVGYVDPAREGKTLVVKNAVLDSLSHVEAAAAAILEAASWVACEHIRIEQASPRGALAALRRAVRA
jgi:uncharacterized protein YcaQ